MSAEERLLSVQTRAGVRPQGRLLRRSAPPYYLWLFAYEITDSTPRIGLDSHGGVHAAVVERLQNLAQPGLIAAHPRYASPQHWQGVNSRHFFAYATPRVVAGELRFFLPDSRQLFSEIVPDVSWDPRPPGTYRCLADELEGVPLQAAFGGLQ
jgi:hypothetical protein